MMKFPFRYLATGVIVSLALAGQTVLAQSIADEYVFPDPDRRIVVVQATSQGDRKLTGRIMDSRDSLSILALEDLNLPFNRQMIRMSQCARNRVGNNKGPNVLFISKNEGGFPRKGIWLDEGSGKEVHYPDLQFVDLVLTEGRILNGELSIYTHELGHVMMGLILDEALEKLSLDRSPKQHVSMGITDYLTALSEGWGIHFQRLAYDRVTRYQQAFTEKLSPERSMSLVWHSGLDEKLRIQLVKDNGYIYEKFVHTWPSTGPLTPEQRILLEHTSPAFDHSRIKNAQQMLSCEGVIATLFYQVNSDPKLGGNYLPIDFYTPFLVKPLPDDLDPAKVFTPLENMMLKNFSVWTELAETGIRGNPVIAWLQEWCRQFPNDREQLIKLFILITRGATISNELPRMTEQINMKGQIGDYQAFMDAMPGYQLLVQKLVQEAVVNPSRLSANIGPEIWVLSKKVKIRRALWFADPTQPLKINLNTAGLAELEVFMSPAQASAFLEKRRELGYFSSMQQITQAGFYIQQN